MAAVKAYFYKLREDMPDVCEGVDIPRYIESLSMAFGRASLADVDRAEKLPGGPIYYTDTPRNLHESPGLDEAISNCLRNFDKDGTARRALSEIIADKIMTDELFRERLFSYDRVPQSWSDMLRPEDPEEELNRDEIVEALYTLQDRNYSHRHNARGRMHPLARIYESDLFPPVEKLAFIADYMIGRKKEGYAPWAVRIGSHGNYQEFNRASWLDQNRAYVLETVGDVLKLQKHFTATNKLKKGPQPELPQLEPGALAPSIKSPS